MKRAIAGDNYISYITLSCGLQDSSNIPSGDAQ